MPHFSSTVQAMAAGQTVRVLPLVRLEFLSETMRLHTASGDRVAGGFTWKGLGALASIGSISLSPGIQSDAVELSLSGIHETVLAGALNQGEEIYGREAQIYLQFFTETWATLDTPYSIMRGQMDQMPLTIEFGKATARLFVEDIMLDKLRPPYGNFSDADQQARFPGDECFYRTPLYKNRRIKWP